MFAVYCQACSRRELIFASQLLGGRNDRDGIHVAFRCSRGHVGELVTGRRATSA